MAISLFLGGVEACQYDLWYLRTLKMVTIKSAKKRCTEMTTLVLWYQEPTSLQEFPRLDSGSPSLTSLHFPHILNPALDPPSGVC